MTMEAEALRSAIADRTGATFEERSAALAEIIRLANFADNHWVRAHAIQHLQGVEGIAVITDVVQLPVLATSDGVHIEPLVAVR